MLLDSCSSPSLACMPVEWPPPLTIRQLNLLGSLFVSHSSLLLLCVCARPSNPISTEGEHEGGPTDADFGVSSSPATDGDSEHSDPFATVDGASSSNAGAYDSFSNQTPEVKEEEAAALKSVQTEMGMRVGGDLGAVFAVQYCF